MSHEPALEAHEHREHAEHAAHTGDPFIAKVSITIAVLAVLAATAGSMETVEAGRAIANSTEAVLAQDQATDIWSEYQAGSLKKHMYGLAADAGGAQAERYRQEAARQEARQGGLRDDARKHEAERDRLNQRSRVHEERHHWLTAASTLVDIGIALSTVAIITRRRGFWLGAVGLGAGGIGLFTLAYLI